MNTCFELTRIQSICGETLCGFESRRPHQPIWSYVASAEPSARRGGVEARLPASTAEN
jgi:hypothetical protein